MIRVENPYSAQLDDAEANAESIEREFGPTALAELRHVLPLQLDAFRFSARSQLEACMADLRTWPRSTGRRVPTQEAMVSRGRRSQLRSLSTTWDWLSEATGTKE